MWAWIISADWAPVVTIKLFYKNIQDAGGVKEKVDKESIQAQR